MLMNLTRIAVAALVLLIGAALMPARAAGTPDEAKALAEKAAALVAAEGEKAFPKFNDPNGGFVQGDLYVVVLDSKGVVHANMNPKMIGVSMWDVKDPDGVPFTQNILKLAASSETGWASFKFTNPVSKKIEPKKAWVHKVGDYVVLCGAYVKE